MKYLAEKIWNLGAYGFSFAGIVINFDNIKGLIFFGIGVTLGIHQIIYYRVKIKNERKNGL